VTPNRLHWLDPWLGRDVFPDWLIRVGIRRLLRQRLREERRGGVEAQQERLSRLVAELRRSPIAIHVEAANAQHYEVPAAFYQRVLGQRLKYSSGYWPEGVVTLDHAEEAMLALTCERAGVENGQRILELGCGWGSLSLWLAERYPQSRITAITNSRSQGAYIDSERRRLGLDRLAVVVTDMNVFETKERFDRVLSVEMFEHMRNYAELPNRPLARARGSSLRPYVRQRPQRLRVRRSRQR
jgi:cyclopropane-fatty-acyl-phospholipid synthase